MPNPNELSAADIQIAMESIVKLSDFAKFVTKHLDKDLASKLFSSELDYSFITSDNTLKDELEKNRQRMFIHKYNFLNLESTEAFDNYCRFAHIQVEGLLDLYVKNKYQTPEKLIARIWEYNFHKHVLQEDKKQLNDVIRGKCDKSNINIVSLIQFLYDSKIAKKEYKDIERSVELNPLLDAIQSNEVQEKLKSVNDYNKQKSANYSEERATKIDVANFYSYGLIVIKNNSFTEINTKPKLDVFHQDFLRTEKSQSKFLMTRINLNKYRNQVSHLASSDKSSEADKSNLEKFFIKNISTKNHILDSLTEMISVVKAFYSGTTQTAQ